MQGFSLKKFNKQTRIGSLDHKVRNLYSALIQVTQQRQRYEEALHVFAEGSNWGSTPEKTTIWVEEFNPEAFARFILEGKSVEEWEALMEKARSTVSVEA